jgi:hypothetical protein
MGPRALTSIPTGPETAVWRALVSVLRADAAFNAIMPKPTLRAWEGDNLSDVADPNAGGNEPSASELPFVRMTPASYPTGWWTEGAHKGDWVIRFNIYTPGSNLEDFTDFCNAIRSAYFPTDPSQKVVVKAEMAVVSVLRPQFNGFGLDGLLGQSRYGLKGVCTLRVGIQVNTW